MTLLLVALLAPLICALFAAYLVLKAAAFGVRLIFAPVVWLNGRPTKQRIDLRHHTASDER